MDTETVFLVMGGLGWVILSTVINIRFNRHKNTQNGKSIDSSSSSFSTDNSDSEIKTINSSNGSLMIDGMNSTDTYGNSYGSSINDPFNDKY